MLAPHYQEVASLLKGGLNFGCVPSVFWLGKGSRNWTFWVVLLCESFLFQYTQNWKLSHVEICLWLDNVTLEGNCLYMAGLGEEGQKPWAWHSSTCTWYELPDPVLPGISETSAETTDHSPPWILTIRLSLITAWLQLARWVVSDVNDLVMRHLCF